MLGVWLRKSVFGALLLLPLLWPLAVNRTPVMFSDSVAYLTGGSQVWRLTAKIIGKRSLNAVAAPASFPGNAGSSAPNAEPVWSLNGARSLYYGTFAWTLRMFGGWRTIVLVQAIWIGIVAGAALRHLGIVRGRDRLIAFAVLGLTTSLAFFTDVILPDVFTGVVPLSVAMLVFFEADMRRRERWLWLAGLTAIIVFHKSFAALAICSLVIGILIDRHGWRKNRGIVMSGTAIALATVLTLIVAPLAKRFGHVDTINPPFLLARTIGDGTAEMVLRDQCPATAYSSCKILPALPMLENDYLWGDNSYSWDRLSPANRARSDNEQTAIVLAILTHYPAAQARQSAINVARQVVDLDLSEFKRRALVEKFMIAGRLDSEVRDMRRSLIWKSVFPLDLMALIWTACYAATLLFSITALLLRRWLLTDISSRLTATATLLLGSVAANAMMLAVLSGDFGRYQAKISWLTTFTALILGQHMLSRRSVNQPSNGSVKQMSKHRVVNPAFGLVPAAPASGAGVFAGSDLGGARNAAD